MGEMVHNIAISLFDKNKNGDVKDDLFRMLLNYIKTKFAKK